MYHIALKVERCMTFKVEMRNVIVHLYRSRTGFISKVTVSQRYSGSVRHGYEVGTLSTRRLRAAGASSPRHLSSSKYREIQEPAFLLNFVKIFVRCPLSTLHRALRKVSFCRKPCKKPVKRGKFFQPATELAE